MTSRPLSQLIYKRVQDNGASPRILTLHKYNQYGQDVKEYAFAASPDARIIGLESYKGVFLEKSIVGYTWFVGPFDRPSPLFFGDALAEIERFLWDEIDRQEGDQAELPFLIGVEQGAIMALAAAAAVPDLISGAIAVDAALPVVPGWEPPLAPLDGLPILQIDDPARQPVQGVLSGDELAETFTRWGGIVTRVSVPEPSSQVPAEPMARWMGAHTPRFRSKDAS
jgi:pimeloyl-ACP methyl ester carboxylesterase